jgi:hypothetical protein
VGFRGVDIVGFLEDLAAQKSAERQTADVEILLNGHLYRLHVTQMDGMEWASIVDKYPARPGILIDQRYGYNLRALTKGELHRCAVLYDGDDVVPLRRDPIGAKNRVDQWADLFKAIDGNATQRVCDAVWGLNEYDPEQAVIAAKKALSSFARS